MTNKEKARIEVMAEEIEKRMEQAKNVVGSMNKGISYWIAEDLVDKNYRKVNENEVVRLEEENKRLRKMPEKVYAEMTERLKAEVAIERRMTAKEILQSLYNNNERPQFMEVYIKTLADKYGVEIKE